MSTLTDLLLPQGPAQCLAPALLECLDTLAQVAAALSLADTRPASLVAAAAQAAADAQAAQDSEEAAFEVGRQVDAQLAAMQAALAELHLLAEGLDAAAAARQADVERWTAEVGPAQQRAAAYVAKQRQLEERLAERGVCPEIMQSVLQARGRQHAAAAAELARVQRQLERYCELPADPAEAAAAMQRTRRELAALRQRLQEQLAGIQ